MRAILAIGIFATLSLCACNVFNGITIMNQPEPLNTNGDADVTYVRAVQATNGTWSFYVTVSHEDTGWDDYANGWDVVLPDGTVIKPNASGEFTRLLLHPHVDEQPFTRSQSGIELPENITQVTVRAHDIVDGFGGHEIVVYLNVSQGEGFEVEKAN